MIEFISADDNLMATLAEGGGIDPAPRALMPPQWYSGEEGLDTITVLIDAMQDEPQKLGTEGSQVLEELREFETVLRKTAAR